MGYWEGIFWIFNAAQFATIFLIAVEVAFFEMTPSESGQSEGWISAFVFIGNADRKSDFFSLACSSSSQFGSNNPWSML